MDGVNRGDATASAAVTSDLLAPAGQLGQRTLHSRHAPSG
jgi:hypothetical protein